MNKCGRRGPHFDAMLREFASLMIKRSSGCSLLQGPFALPPTVAMAKVLSCWGSRLTWTAQREHDAQVIRAVESHKSATSFMSVVHNCGGTPGRRAGGQAGWQSCGRAGWLAGGFHAQVPTEPIGPIPYGTVRYRTDPARSRGFLRSKWAGILAGSLLYWLAGWRAGFLHRVLRCRL